ncbi:MAG: nuclear transport factor 2 family protein [Candidatus Neomarinimicrobiota bacterium]
MIDLLQIWVEKIKINDAKQVAALYHEDGLLLGTFSDVERKGQKLILDYFENLFISKVDVKIITKHEFKTESISSVSGLYNFLLNDKEIKARFSFVFLKKKEFWKILSHHSSVLPHKN